MIDQKFQAWGSLKAFAISNKWALLHLLHDPELTHVITTIFLNYQQPLARSFDSRSTLDLTPYGHRSPFTLSSGSSDLILFFFFLFFFNPRELVSIAMN